MATSSGGERFTLITNVHFVVLPGCRCFAHALLLERWRSPLDGLMDGRGRDGPPRSQIRGFGTHAALPIFDLDVPTLDFEAVDAASRAVFIGNSGKPRPLSSGAILAFKEGGPEIQVVAEDASRPLDFSDYPDHCSVWDALTSKVAEYWHAPNFPGLTWLPSSAFKHGEASPFADDRGANG